MRQTISRFAAIPVLLAGTALWSSPALAESEGRGVLGCSPRADIVDRLEQHYGEYFSGQARQSDKGLVELYVASDGSWTIILTRPDGYSCPMAVGSNAEKVFNRKGLGGMPI